MTEDKMLGWHHQLSGHEFEQASGLSDGQESLVCCSPWGCKESNNPERSYYFPLPLNFISYYYIDEESKAEMLRVLIMITQQKVAKVG